MHTMADKPLPQGIELTPLNDSFREDLYPILSRLQSEAPVLEDSELKRFIYSQHDDVKTILRDPGIWSDPRKAKTAVNNNSADITNTHPETPHVGISSLVSA